MVDIDMIVKSTPQSQTRAMPPLSRLPAADDTGAEMAKLHGRILAARIAREHHVWEALRLLPSLAALRENATAVRRFRALMERDALVDAVLFLAAAGHPSRTPNRLAVKNDAFICTFRCIGEGSNQSSRFVSATHTDRAAALLAALIASDQRT